MNWYCLTNEGVWENGKLITKEMGDKLDKVFLFGGAIKWIQRKWYNPEIDKACDKRDCMHHYGFSMQNGHLIIRSSSCIFCKHLKKIDNYIKKDKK